MPPQIEAPPPPMATKAEEAADGEAVVIRVKDDVGDEKVSRADVVKQVEEDDFEKVCRVCHLSSDRTTKEDDDELIEIGCGCKNELGAAHRHCVETWFRLKGNRCCEICGLTAKNVTGIGDGSFIKEWHENRLPSSSNNGNRNSSERVGCWRGQPFCNFLMACLVIAFILAWFLRVNIF